MKKTSQPRNETEKLTERLRELSYLGSAINVLLWDQEVNMPKKGAPARASSISILTGLVHGRFLKIDDDGILSRLKKRLDLRTGAKLGTGRGDKKLSKQEVVIVRETWRSFERARKLTETFVKELAKLTSTAQNVWAEARKKNDFAIFTPYLQRIIEMKREEAKLLGYEASPYDALIDEYEPGMISSELERIFTDLKSFLIPFISHIRKVSSSVRPHTIAKSASFPIERQVEFNKKIAEAMGYDFDAGRIDLSTHPFTNGFHPHDVRFTTRYNPKNPFESILPVLHEGGHALYDQGLPHEHFGTPLSDAISLGIHESQSRLWENMVGRGLSFWKHWYPKLQKEFPGAFVFPLNDFYRSLNIVKPSLIRVEADEATYNLHIIIRFELEKALIEGTIEAQDLPRLWGERYKEYLGIAPKTDKEGVLQDVHWSTGYFGYFPTYTLGNLYAAQFWNTAKKEISGLEQKIAEGDLKTLREWLRKNIHLHGKIYSATELATRLTGEKLNPDHFSNYLREKYEKIYDL